MSNREQQSGVVIHAEVTRLTVVEFAEISGLSLEEVGELVEVGVFSPSGHASNEWLFDARTVALVRKLCRLREDFDVHLDLHALGLTFRLLERICELEDQLCRERASRLCDSA